MDTQDKDKLKAAIFSTDDKADGFEMLTPDTMAVPFLRLLQKLSPQIDKKKPEYIDGAEDGMFFNTITKKLIGSVFECVVLKFERIYIEWKPNRGGFVSYHAPEHAEQLATDRTFGKWRTSTGNELQENYVYLVLVAGHEQDGVMVLSLSSTAIRAAREWNRLMTTHILPNGKKALPYYLIWHITTEYKENEKGSWYVPSMRFVDYVDAAMYERAKAERMLTRNIDYKAIEGPQNDITDTPF